jgi:hypothetical protein
MKTDLPEMSPLLLNTLGGLCAIILIIGIIYALTKFAKTVKGNGMASASVESSSGGFCIHSQLFTDTRDAAIGAKAAAMRNEKTLGTLNDVLQSMDRSLTEIKVSSKNQEKLLTQLVEMRSKFVKAQ